MSTLETTTRYRLAQWAEIIQERNSRGVTIDSYCLSKGISKNAYYYWLRKLRQTASEQLAELQPTQTGLAVQGFAEVRLNEPPVTSSAIGSNHVCIETCSYKVTAGSGYPTGPLVTLLRELAKEC